MRSLGLPSVLIEITWSRTIERLFINLRKIMLVDFKSIFLIQLVQMDAGWIVLIHFFYLNEIKNVS